jgi:hypothetical protein
MKKIQINAGHYLELMDRLHIIASNLDEHCVDHPLTQSDKQIRFKIEYALEQVLDAYQYVGQKEFENENENNTH